MYFSNCDPEMALFYELRFVEQQETLHFISLPLLSKATYNECIQPRGAEPEQQEIRKCHICAIVLREQVFMLNTSFSRLISLSD